MAEQQEPAPLPARLMIVEDDEVVASTLRKTLQRRGYVLSAWVRSGAEALRQAALTQPDLALMDIRLAGDMDGLETARRLRERFDIPVLIITGFADEHILERAKAIHPLGFLTKPFSAEDLVATIEVGLHRHRTERTQRRLTDQTLANKDQLLQAFHQIGKMILASLDLDQIVERLARQIIELGVFRSLMVALVHPTDGSVEVVQGLVRSANGVERTEYPNGQARYARDDRNITAEVARTGEPQVIVGWDDRFAPNADPADFPQDCVSYFIPIKQGEDVVAVLATGSVTGEKEEMLRRIAAMDPLLDLVAVALEHARTHQALQRVLRLEQIRGRLRARLLATDTLEDFATAHILTELRAGLRSLGIPISGGLSLQRRCSRPDYFSSGAELFSATPNENLLADFPWVREAWETGLPVRVDQKRLREFLPGVDISCILEIPLPGWGSLGLNSREEDAFDAETIQVIQTCTGILTEGLMRLQTLEALQSAHDLLEHRVEARTVELQQTNDALRREIAERQQTEKLLFIQRDLATALNATPQWQEGLRLCLLAAIQASSLDCGAIYLVDERSGDLLLVHHHGLPAEFTGPPTHIAADADDARLLLRKTVTYGCYPQLGFSLEAHCGKERLRAMARVPILHQERVIACMCMASRTRDEITAPERAALEAIAAQIGSAVSRLRAEKSQRESEERYRILVENAYDLIYTYDFAGRFTSANAAVTQVLGYTPEEVLQLDMKQLVDPEYLDLAREKLREKVEGKPRTEPYEVLARAKDGSPVWLETTSQVMQGADSPRIMGIARDITKRRQLEEQLRISQKMEAIGELTAGIAHNFNNRLMAVSSSLESMRLQQTFDEEKIAAAEASVWQAAEMIDQLMLFSRADEQVAQVPITVRQTLQSAVEICRRNFDRKIAIVEQTAAALPMVQANANQLEQVFLNLLLNARDALEEAHTHSPRIHVEASCVVLREGETCPPALPGEYVRIRIRDNGSGMSTQTQQHLFEPFFTTKEVGKGTGLGLATAFGILQTHHGWISCESQLGIGTTFSIYLPAATQQEEPSPAADADPPEVAHGREMILFVEDEADVRDSVVSFLEDFGYSVLSGEDGEQGWELFQRESRRIALTILDLSMPRMSGTELFARIRAADPQARIILSTGHVDPSTEALDAQALLKKPFRLTQALETIRQVLDD